MEVERHKAFLGLQTSWKCLPECGLKLLSVQLKVYIKMHETIIQVVKMIQVFCRWLVKYTKKHGPLNYMRPCETLRKCPKWKVVPNDASQVKRSKTSESESYNTGSSDARCTININDDSEFEDEALTLESERSI
ncbi:hypothetical protein HanPI659440_Chr03g0105921 [Helianthus annuus]|nr:hypothetical protein HanPI659440_Chr03g0105921 [Helianthus annuus]